MVSTQSDQSLQEWADIRQTSIEIARAIFTLAKGDDTLAQQIWDEGSDEVVKQAFANTDKDTLFWGEQTLSRACGE